MKRSRSGAVSILSVVVALFLSGCRDSDTALPSGATSDTRTTSLLMSFDPGFLLIERRSNGSVTAALPLDPPETPHHEQHDLWIGVLTGTVESDEKDPMSLSGYALVVEGLPSARVTMPPYSMPRYNTDRCEPAVTTAAAINNRYFLPDLAELHPGAGVDLRPELLRSRIDLTGGEIAIRAAEGCWTLKAGTQERAAQPLVYGSESLEYKAPMAPGNVTLRLRPLAGGAEKTIVIRPEQSQIKVRLYFPSVPTDYAEVGDPMPDFADAYPLVTPAVAAADRYIPIQGVSRPSQGGRPGRECGFKYIKVD